MIHKGKNWKTGLNENLKICFAKVPAKKMKIQATDWEKSFANHTFNEGLVSGIYQEL